MEIKEEEENTGTKPDFSHCWYYAVISKIVRKLTLSIFGLGAKNLANKWLAYPHDPHKQFMKKTKRKIIFKASSKEFNVK